MIYRFRTIGVDIYGNKEIKGVYDTEVKIDMDLPKSELWLSEGHIQFTNVDGVTINWKEMRPTTFRDTSLNSRK